MFAILVCVVMALLAWAGAWAGWRDSHGASVLLALLGCAALVMAVVPLTQPS